MALSAEETEIGKRLQSVRRAHGASQSLVARRIFLSRDQVKRIERGEVSIRFMPGLRFCELMNISPLWLAFGDPENPFHFYWLYYDASHEAGYRILTNITSVAASEIESDAIFLDVMKRHRENYQTAGRSISDDERQRLGLLRAILLNRDIVKQQLTIRAELGKVGSMNLGRVSFWPKLRKRIQRLVRKRGMKSTLAGDIGITRQAVNALLKRKYIPSGEQVLKLSEWVKAAEAQQKQSAGSAETRPAQSTRKSKSTRNEKAKSSRKKP